MVNIYMLNKIYKIQHKKIRNISIPAKLIMENIMDFEHVNFVHKKCFKYNRLIFKKDRVSILEYGVKIFPFIPFYVNHFIMIHEQISEYEVRHISRNLNNKRWIESRMSLKEKKSRGRNYTEYISTHELYLPLFLLPFKKLILKIIDNWSNIVWSEDYDILKRKMKLEKNNFINAPACGVWLKKDGIFYYDANNKKIHKQM
jgi:hypothetical protein